MGEPRHRTSRKWRKTGGSGWKKAPPGARNGSGGRRRFARRLSLAFRRVRHGIASGHAGKHSISRCAIWSRLSMAGRAGARRSAAAASAARSTPPARRPTARRSQAGSRAGTQPEQAARTSRPTALSSSPLLRSVRSQRFRPASPCIISIIRTACSTPRMSISRAPRRRGRHAVLLLFDGDARAALPVLADAFAGQDALICFARQSQLQPGGARDAGTASAPAWTSSRRASCGARWPPACRQTRSSSPASARRARRWLSRWTAGHPRLQRRERAGARALSEVAASSATRRPLALRVNPDVDAKTHAKISTGKAENKFGIPYRRGAAALCAGRKLPGIAATGIHMHIGSQITDLAPFRDAFAADARAGRGRCSPTATSSSTSTSAAASACPTGRRTSAAAARRVRRRGEGARSATSGSSSFFEPGRVIVGNAGMLVTRVIYVKEGGDKTFTIVDAAMNDLIRPTLYEAQHDIWPVQEGASGACHRSCRTWSGRSARRATISRSTATCRRSRGDLLAVMTAGAYGAVMSSHLQYAAVGAGGAGERGRARRVVRPRQTYEELIGLDRLRPGWRQAGKA